MKIQAAKLHRLVVNARIFQNVKSSGAEFHANPQYLTMFSSDPTTMITDSAGLEEPYGDKMTKWVWDPDQLKFWDMNLRGVPDEEVFDLAIDQPLDGDYQIDTYLDLLDRRRYAAGDWEFTIWGDRLGKLRLIKPGGFPIKFESVNHVTLKRSFLAFSVGPTVRGIVTVVEE